MKMKIRFNIRKGKANGSNFMFKKIGWYPEWFLEVDLEEGKNTVSPTISNVKEITRKILLYERIQRYDFFKLNQDVEGDIKKQFDTLLKEIDKTSLEEVRKEFLEYPVYEETLKRKEEIFNETKKEE